MNRQQHPTITAKRSYVTANVAQQRQEFDLEMERYEERELVNELRKRVKVAGKIKPADRETF